MKPRSTLKIIFAAMLGALAILVLPAAASAKDRNHDRIPDRWEQRHHLSLSVNQARRDQDHDGLRNRGEFEAGDDPRNDDSDGDGVMDGDENAGTIAAFDSESGKLTIALFNGDSISGLVGSGTEIRCEGTADERLIAARDGGPGPSGGDDNGGQHGEPGDDDGHGEEAGDDNGGHGEEAGDDNGGQGEEPGDDNGGQEEPGDDDNGGAAGNQDNSGPGSANSGRGHHGEHGDHHEHGVPCTTADLEVGGTVHEADLEIEHGNAFFDEIELAHTT